MITLQDVLMPLLIFAVVGAAGLFAALRPEACCRYLLAESQRKAVSGNLKAVSVTGWIIFCGSVVVVIAIPYYDRWNAFSPLFFLICAAAYLWWGIGLVRNPESFLKRSSQPWNRMPIRIVRGLGALLLLASTLFLFGFVKHFLR